MEMTAAEIFGVGGPAAGVAALLGFLLKAYLEKRGADRDDVKADRESESGIVETTRQALALARQEMLETDARRQKERDDCDQKIARLTAENERLTAALLQARNLNDDHARTRNKSQRSARESRAVDGQPGAE
jgi:methylthioribose-1-phosphate isomerase